MPTPVARNGSWQRSVGVKPWRTLAEHRFLPAGKITSGKKVRPTMAFLSLCRKLFTLRGNLLSAKRPYFVRHRDRSMVISRYPFLLSALFSGLVVFSSGSAVATGPPPINAGQSGTITRRPNLGITRWQETGPGEGSWTFRSPTKPQYLITDPTAGAMSRGFSLHPRDISETNLQPGWTGSVREYYFVSDGVTLNGGEIPRGLAITGWNSQVLTLGWEWVVPLPESSDAPLISNGGLPWDWEYADREPQDWGLHGALPNDWKYADWEQNSDRAWLSVKFSAIEPGDLFVIQKQLRWRGTPDNTVWGDNQLDDGTSLRREATITIVDYPIVVPEPATFVLALAATFHLVCTRRRT